jgi:5-methylcytosine-specific restriction protein A
MPYLPTTTKYKWIRKIKKDYNKSYSKPEYAKIYNSHRWRKLREYFIKNNPLCKICKKNNRIKESKVVDHIVEIADGGGVWDFSNLQALCDPCHRIKTAHAVNRRKKNKKNIK